MLSFDGLKRWGWVVAWVGTFSACSSVDPYRNSRSGLLDRLGELPGLDRRVSNHLGQLVREEEETLKRLRGATEAWTWPLRTVKVTSSFGRRGSDMHEGVDLRARIGTTVYAVERGRVVYAGRKIRGYGKMVVIRHDSGLSSVYAHNSKILVRKGQKVKKGQRIALSGNTGRTRGPHLHFEVRYGVVAVDPSKLLPGVHFALPDPPAREVALREK